MANSEASYELEELQSEKSNVLKDTSFKLKNLQDEITKLNKLEVWPKGGSRNSAKESEWQKQNSEKQKKLTKGAWTIEWPSGTETWYDLPMNGVIKYMRDLWYTEDKWYNFRIRNDGVKMLWNYVMVAANLKKRPKWTILKTSLGMWIVCDKCERAYQRGKEKLLDVAVNWRHEKHKKK